MSADIPTLGPSPRAGIRPIDSRSFIESTVDPASGTIKIITTLMGQATVDLLNTREEVIRQALIALGWTPPPEVD